jgi:nitrite reductase/ring-hydroxylating ferredoxin subunit/uncharacterized membrane protein
MATEITLRDVARLAAGDVANQKWLDGTASQLQEWLRGLIKDGGEPALKVRDLLNGVWLGHPLHPVLTDITIGAWTMSLVMDAVNAPKQADQLLGLGILSAIPTAMTGSADWSETDDRSRRVGLVHAVLNSGALVLYLGSLAARANRHRGAGQALSLAAFALTTGSAWLGGSMVFKQGTGVDRNAFTPEVEKWQKVVRLDALKEGELTKGEVTVDGQPVPLVLLKRGGEVLALSDTCSHLGGPLSEGKLEDECVTCPWHGSTFNLYDGHVTRGPATASQPAFETRVTNGQVEVRRAG